jgi:cation transport regulator ChaC
MALVFQYGSNMSNGRLNHADRLNGDAKFVYVAKTIESFELGFSIWSNSNECAAADIAESKAGRNIIGVVYEIPDDLVTREASKRHQRKSMDAIEGEGKNYIRRTIDLEREDGSRLTALTYVVKERRDGLKTQMHYVRHILDGLREHKLPSDYRTYVVERVLANNPSLAPEVQAYHFDA